MLEKSAPESEEYHGLIVDMNPASGCADTIKSILDASHNPFVKILRTSVIDSDAPPCRIALEKMLADVRPAIVFLSLSSRNDLRVSEKIKSLIKELGKLPIIAIIDEGRTHAAIDILRLGVADIIIPPIKASDVCSRVRRLLERKNGNNALLASLKQKIGLQQLIGESPRFLQELEKIPVLARCDSSVLISGETGTGKEMCARAIHYLSPRSGYPFLPVNCGAIPADLVENELFGHVRGAFTGASEAHEGMIGEACGGTLFLDEIDCLPLSAQAKLLRFAQEKEYRSLGSAKIREANVRIIAATNTNLAHAVEDGKFRRDLYYRLTITELELPPLRERPEDIQLLARHFLAISGEEVDADGAAAAPEVFLKLSQYDWPGNIRELENVIHRAVIFAKGRVIRENDIILPRPTAAVQRESFKAEKAKVIAEFEKRYMLELLQTHQGNITKAAKAAQKNRRAFWELMRKHDIDIQKYKPLSS